MFLQFSFYGTFVGHAKVKRDHKVIVFNNHYLTMQANDQKKLKKMVEELANKYGKTEDEIFYAYDQ